MIVLGAEGTRKVGIKGWTERRMGVWYPTRGQIGNRSDPHGKHRNDARPFLINRQPLFFLRPSLLSPLPQNSPILHLDPFRIEEVGDRLTRSSVSASQLPASFRSSCQRRVFISFSFLLRERNVPRIRVQVFLSLFGECVTAPSILYPLRFIIHR